MARWLCWHEIEATKLVVPGPGIISLVHMALVEAGYAAQNRHEKAANRSDERFRCHTSLF